MQQDVFNDQLENKATIIPAEEGETFGMNGIVISLKVTSEMSNDQLGVYEIILQPHTIGAKLHYHRFMDETFIVTKGVLTIQLKDKEVQVKEGAVAYAPRFTPHGFRNDSEEEVRVLLIFNPGQKREGFFRGLYETLSESPIDPDKYLKLYNKYDSFPVDTNNMLPVHDQ
ncbi:MAG: cupin domain-containing protein [Flavipsychrobacter sp.]